ncbi:uncharacterized protein LOC132063227 [Lycium ferocissimum]|uniref:uncharacterized protein LOC132063227 n=1 Tax=Lycium ferocissimum TaxID=112874 RepID=UPI0028162FF3|nr:uncharacterized protein LOC132063227 [Lycium ferocissimum]
MKVHPVPRKRNITLQYDISSALSQASRQKKLRRLPHIFAKVLELPFNSDTDVSIQETSDSLRFIIPTDDTAGDNIRADTVEIYPGVTKIVIRGDNINDLDAALCEFELDMWRFRLPPSTLPELATAVNSDGVLVVTVPKDTDDLDDDGDIGRLILLQ